LADSEVWRAGVEAWRRRLEGFPYGPETKEDVERRWRDEFSCACEVRECDVDRDVSEECEVCVCDGVIVGDSVKFFVGRGETSVSDFLGPDFVNLPKYQINVFHSSTHFDSVLGKSQFCHPFAFCSQLLHSVLQFPNKIARIHARKAIFWGVFDLPLSKPESAVDPPRFVLKASVVVGVGLSVSVNTFYPGKSLS
jgi:hypothetical protein